MKEVLCSILTLLIFLTLTNSFAQEIKSPENTVRVIYFLPNDRAPHPNIDRKLDTLIKEVQQFYANEMERHGFGRKTFRLETDVGGKLLAHHIKGQHAATYYNPLDTILVDRPDPFGKVLTEIDEQFDTSQTIYLIAADITSTASYWRGGGQAHLGGHTILYIPSDDHFISFYHAGHELAHSFGLQHDLRFRTNISEADITSYTVGIDPKNRRLSKCAAEWLDVHPYFNPNQTTLNEPTTIQMLAPLAYPPNAISLRFRVTDPDKLHQAQLVIPRGDGFSLHGCKSFNGEARTTIEFITTELTASRNEVALGIIDVHGNFRWESYPIEVDNIDPVNGVIPVENLAPETLRKVSGDNQRGYLNTRLIDPFVVTVRDADDEPVPGVQVMFEVISGEGHLSVRHPWTDSDGQASSFLTTGSQQGEYRVAASVSGVSSPLTFRATVNTEIVPSRHQKTLVGHTDVVSSVVYSPSGTTLASGSWDHTIRLWDVHTGRLLRTLEGHTGSVENIAFSPNGLTLASGSSDDTIRLWDPITGRHKRTIHGRSYSIPSIAYSPDGETLATGTLTGEIHLWDATTGQHKKTLIGHRGTLAKNVLRIAFTPDGLTLISGGSDGTTRLWDVVTGEQLKIISLPLRHPPYIDGGFAFSPEGRKLAYFTGWGLTIELWDLVTEQHEKMLIGHTTGVYAGAFSPNGGMLATGSFDSEIRLWDTATGGLLTILIGHTKSIRDLAFSPDGNTLASASEDYNVLLWAIPPPAAAQLKTEGRAGTDETPAPSPEITPVVHVGAANRPPMLWVDGGKIYALVGAEVQEFGLGIENAMNIAISRNKVYWTEKTGESAGTINSANLDGSGVKELKAIKAVPHGIAVDTAGRKLYWTNSRGRVQSANLDGSRIRTDFQANVMTEIFPTSIIFNNGSIYFLDKNPIVTDDSILLRFKSGPQQDRFAIGIPGDVNDFVISGRKIYYTTITGKSAGTINSVSLEGSGRVTEAEIQAAPYGIAVDTARSKLYWTDSFGRIQSANLDGSGIRNVVTGLGNPGDMVISNRIQAPTTAGKSKYDINGDGSVNSKDVDAILLAVLAELTDAKYDVNGDGKVDVSDVKAVNGNLDAGAAAAPALLGTQFSALEVDRLREQIDLLIATGDQSPAAMRTLIYLTATHCDGTSREDAALGELSESVQPRDLDPL